MMALPPEIERALTETVGVPRQATPLSGGDVNHAALVTLDSWAVVKWKDNAPSGFFADEADGLRRLRGASPLRVPTVLAFGDFPAFLALEYLPPQQPSDPARFARRLGEGLAALHHNNPAPNSLFGLNKDNFLGSQPQANTPHQDWPAFYRDCRLRPQIDKAKGRGLLPPPRERLLGAVVDALETLLADLPARPVLIHGDLWSGNFLCAADDLPVIIDPAVYYGEREVEMAFTELFGGFPVGFLPTYQSAFPLDSGYPRRRALHQLYPLLVHLNHFGETYGPAVDRACRQYL